MRGALPVRIVSVISPSAFQISGSALNNKPANAHPSIAARHAPVSSYRCGPAERSSPVAATQRSTRRRIPASAPHRSASSSTVSGPAASCSKAPMLSSPLMAVNRQVAHVVSSRIRTPAAAGASVA